MRLPYLYFVLDLGWLFTVHSNLYYRVMGERKFSWIRLEGQVCGRRYGIGLYSPDSHYGTVKAAFRWRCKFWHKQEKVLDGYSLEDWVKCSCGRKWRAVEDL